MFESLFFALGLANNVLLIVLFSVRKGRPLSIVRRIGYLYLLLALPAIGALYLAGREHVTVRYTIFLAIFLAFLALEALYDFVLQVPFRENMRQYWKLIVPYLCLYYAMNYGFVVMVWKSSLPRGILMLALFVVQIVLNTVSHPRGKDKDKERPTDDDQL